MYRRASIGSSRAARTAGQAPSRIPVKQLASAVTINISGINTLGATHPTWARRVSVKSMFTGKRNAEVLRELIAAFVAGDHPVAQDDYAFGVCGNVWFVRHHDNSLTL